MKFTCRSFNSLKISKNIVHKTSIDTKKFINEINWYKECPSSLHKYLPKLKQCCTNLDDLFIEYEIIKDNPISFIFKKSNNFNSDILHNFCSDLQKMLFLFKKHKYEVNNTSCLKKNIIDMYVNKPLERLQKLKLEEPDVVAPFLFDTIWINNKKCYGLNWIISNIQQCSKILYNKKNPFCFIHGDLDFSNIFYNVENRKITLIDPRGSFGNIKLFGDWRYDYAKIMQNVYTPFPLLWNQNLYKIKINNSNIKIDFSSSSYIFWQKFSQIFSNFLPLNSEKEINLIVCLNLLSSIVMNKESKKYMKALIIITILEFNKWIEKWK